MGYQELKDFVDKQEAMNIVLRAVCPPCDVEDCGNCLALNIIEEIDAQVCDATIEHMKTLAKEWGESGE